MEVKQYKNTDMNKQRNEPAKKRVSTEAIQYMIAETQTYISIVVLTCISTVVLTYCRMETRKCFYKEANRQIIASSMIYRNISIIIYSLKDSKK
jgi:hypothetical protein